MRESVIRAAAALARRHKAALTGLCALVPSPSTPADGFVFGPGVAEVMGRHRLADGDRVRAARARFAGIVQQFHISTDFRSSCCVGPGAEAAMSNLQCDLVVTGPSSPLPTSSVQASPSQFLSHGIPVLILPDSPSPTFGRNVVVAWNASLTARRAVSDAMPFLVDAVEVTIVVVDGAGLDGPVSGPSAAELVRHLFCHGILARVRRVVSNGQRVAARLESEAAALDCDLLVLGAYSHSRTRERLLGGVTRTLMAQCPTAIFMSR